MLVHTGKYRDRRQIKNTDNTETKHNLNTAKQNYPGLIASYDTQPGKEVGLFYNAPEPTPSREHKNQCLLASRSAQMCVLTAQKLTFFSLIK